ncbi:hypothetical protein F3Y22_tig00020292pilonHSYRG00015 [Hibiscus syriacus]|uniref:Uncharacterized protein n=1 Tax=Hibiscus syriacus TaxID=106335 RepID=A0A6A3BY05_HIBSY|nr:hypothetical protein F3Y22_tig00020292pilonHSYRG00015 [Hibiscus syriacus]
MKNKAFNPSSFVPQNFYFWKRQQQEQDGGCLGEVRRRPADGVKLERIYMVKPCPKDLKCDVENGATYCTSELSVLKNNEIHTWDRGYDGDGNQVSFAVWGAKEGPYEFEPAPFTPRNFAPSQTLEKRIERSLCWKND